MENLSLSYVQTHPAEVVDRVESQHHRVTITRDGRPIAVLSLDDLESLEETLAVLSDSGLMRQIRQSEEELRRGEKGVTAEELIARYKNLPPVDYEKCARRSTQSSIRRCKRETPRQ